MIPVERVEPLVQESADDTFARGKTAVQNIAVEEILDEGPSHPTRREEGYRSPGVRCRKRESQHEDGVQSGEDGEREQTLAGESRLALFVRSKGNFRGPL